MAHYTMPRVQKLSYRSTNLAYKAGLSSEAQIKQKLVADGYFDQLANSTKYQDVALDIDAWANSTPISIKTQHKALATGNICFELWVLLADTDSSGYQLLTNGKIKLLASSKGKWQESWFFNSQAELYIIAIGDSLYKLYADKLKQYVEQFGFDGYRQLGKQAIANQIGHCHSNSVTGLIKLNKLIDAGVAIQLC